MIQKAQDILLSIFGWVIGPMVTAILAITVLNYQATIEGNKLLVAHKVEQQQETKLIVSQLYRDSLSIIEIKEYLSFTISVIRAANPKLYEKMVTESIEYDSQDKAILPKKKYNFLNK